jgi:heterodisulfide reductase subunit A
LSRIGVFLCECGGNISDTVDVDKVVEEISKHPEVAHAEKYVYMCSDPGQKMLQDAIKEHKLDAIVVAACSPNLHEITFQDAVEAAGLNRYRVEMANIREHCSWVHDDVDSATKKAVKVVKSIVEKVSKNEELTPIRWRL